MGEKSKLRSTISKWANADDMHARELRQTTREAGDCDLIADAVDRKPVALGGDALAKRHQLAEVAGQFFSSRTQFGHHGSEQHGGAERLQRVFRSHQQGRRRAPSRAL